MKYSKRSLKISTWNILQWYNVCGKTTSAIKSGHAWSIYVQAVNNAKNKQIEMSTEATNNEPNIKDLMQMLTSFQTEVTVSFSQSAIAVEQLYLNCL